MTAIAKDDNERERGFLQKRACLFALILFLISLWTDLVELVSLPRTWDLSIQNMIQRGITLTFAMMWLLLRRGHHSERVVHTIEAAGLTITTLAMAVTSRYIVKDIMSDMAFSVPGTDQPSRTAVHAADMFAWFMFVSGGSLVFFLRSALVPSSPVRTLVLTSLASLPYTVLPIFFEPAIMGEIDIRIVPVAVNQSGFFLAWNGVCAAFCTIVSWVIFGLRKQVREARQMGQYTLETKLGEGGMGVVYRARHGMLRRPTAVKLLPPNRKSGTSLARFEREVQLTASLTHPNTVTLFDYGRTSDGVFYYAMELLDGCTLEAVVSASGPQNLGRVIRILEMVCGALSEAHGLGLIHRDIKPANIMLCSSGGERDVVKLLDFGLVKQLDVQRDVELTQADTLTGTPLYLSPEGLRDPDRVDARSDLYALGAVGYFLVTGTPVFVAPTLVEVCSHHLHTIPQPPSERLGKSIGAPLESALLSCLEKDPAHRPQSASELRERLKACNIKTWTSDDAHAWWQQYGDAARSKSAVESEANGLNLTIERDQAQLAIPESGPGRHGLPMTRSNRYNEIHFRALTYRKR